MQIISTAQGEVTLKEPTVKLLRAIRSLLPFGAIRFHPPHQQADYGLVMQCGEGELIGIKRQPPDCDERQGYMLFQMHSILIAHSLSIYLRHGFSGLLLPFAYLRKKQEGKVESGVSFFIYPSEQGRECQEFTEEGAWDGQLGNGFTIMMKGFLQALQQSSEETGLTLWPAFGLDVRQRLQLGTLGFGFAAIGPHVLCLKTRVDPEQDPTWTALRSTGIREVFHLPSTPIAITEDQLAIAKPDSDSLHSG